MKFRIVYVKNGETFVETITATNWTEAKKECERRGTFVGCVYIDTKGDLQYLH